MVLVTLAYLRMSVLTPRPPGPPGHDEPPDVEALEALIEEARRRARRRRRLYGASALVLAAAALTGYFVFDNRGSTSSEVREEPPAGPSGSAQPAAKLAPGIEGGSVSALAVDPNGNVFAATRDAGVFKSANEGRSWRPLAIAARALRVDSLAVAAGEPATVYAGTGRGVFKSTDGGATWQAANGGLFGRETARDRSHRLLEGYVYSLAVDPRDSETVYAGTWRRGLLKTTNAGASWQRLAPRSVGAVVLDPSAPDTMYVGLAGGRAGSGIFTSSDAGRTWRTAGLSGTDVYALAVDPEHAEILYAGTPKGLLKTSNGGKTWGAGGLEGFVSDVDIDRERPATLYAATSSGVHRSTDGGRTWRVLDAGREGRGGVTLALDPQSSARLYAGTGAGVLKSTDAGRSWSVSRSGMNAARVEDLAAVSGNSAYALISSQGFYIRAAGGWRPANARLPTLDLSVLAVDPQRRERVFVVGDRKQIYATTNAGESWRRLAAPPISKTADISALVVDPRHANTLYAGTFERGDYAYGADLGYPSAVFKSIDAGATWRALNTYGMPLPQVSMLAIDPQDPQKLYAAARGVFRSSDGGASWETLVDVFAASSLALDPSKPTTMYAGTQGGALQSSNGGASWRQPDAGFGSGSVNAIAVNPHAPKMVYAGSENGLFISNDRGDTWRRYQGDLGKNGVESLAVDPTGHTLYVGGIGGLVELSLTGARS
jgi:photosystem II stability/assembly factor-like uncharacterized protein